MRLPDWHDRLWETVREHEVIPFSWTQRNCCHFAFAAADAMTGSNRADVVKKFSTTQRQALRHVIEAGGLRAFVSRHFGEPVAGRVQRGDIVLVDTPAGEVAGLWVGNAALVTGEAGLVPYPRDSVLCRWEV
jgi:hypothetical protein